jgi:hypothetical protein
MIPALCRAGVIALIAAAAAFGQTYQWPSIFTVPTRDTTKDSARVRIATKEKVFDNDESTESGLTWDPHLATCHLLQHFIFQTSGDVGFHSTNELYNFSGNIIKDSMLPGNGALGLEWSPTAHLNLRDQAGGYLSIVDLGPVIQWRVDSVPLMLRGGISGAGWNDSLSSTIGQTLKNGDSTAIGVYGGFAIGDSSARILGLPLYLNAQGLGRSIEQDGIAVLLGSALFAHKLKSGDSIFAYYGDSLSNGKEAYLSTSSSGGSQGYLSSPWRIARSLQAAAGIKGAERFNLQPAFYYSYTDKSVQYPSNDSIPSDVRDQLQTFSFMLSSDSAAHLIYRGGLRLTMGNEVWLFDQDFSRFQSRSYSWNHQDTIDATAKMQDHQIYIAAADQYLGLKLSRDWILEYKLSAFRDSKTYQPFAGDTNHNTNDRITINNHLDLALGGTGAWTGSIYGEYATYTVNYLDAQQSGQNSIQTGYRCGLEVKFQPSDRLQLNERMGADAEITDWMWEQVHINPTDLPPYQRTASSNFSWKWDCSRRVELTGRWTETYADNGVWVGSQFISPGKADSMRTNYYGINFKSLDNAVESGVALIRAWGRAEVGCKVQDNFNMQIEDTAAKYNVTPAKIIEPYIDVRVQYHRVSLIGKVVRMINIGSTDAWNINIVGQAAW